MLKQFVKNLCAGIVFLSMLVSCGVQVNVGKDENFLNTIELSQENAFRGRTTASTEWWLKQLGKTTKASKRGSNAGNDYCKGVAVDSLGNSYCAGHTSGAMIESNAGGDDVVIMKFSPTGQLLWLKQLGITTTTALGLNGAGNDYCNDVAVDSTGVYCAGFTTGNLGEARGGGDIYTSDAFVMKFDLNGNFLWLKQFGAVTNPYFGDNSKSDVFKSIALDSSGIYLAGYTSGNMGDKNGDGANLDAIVMKLNLDGKYQWIKQLGQSTPYGKASEVCSGVSVDSNYAYCAGFTTGDMGVISGGGYDAFVMQLNLSSGNVNWLTQIGQSLNYPNGLISTAGNDLCNDVSADSSGVYCAGETNGNLGENNGGFGPDAFVMKLDSFGRFLWLTQFGSTTKGFISGNNSGFDVCRSIAVDSTGVYCAGQTQSAMGEFFGGGPFDVFVMKLDLIKGNLQWLTQFGATTKGPGGDNTGNDIIESIALDPKGNVYCGGSTTGAMGESNGGGNLNDVLVMKLNPVNGKLY